MLKKEELRWVQGCVATAAALFVQASLPAGASQKHVLKPGESLSAVARKFGVSVKDILQANAITDASSVRDGKILTVPDPPKGLSVPKTIKESRFIGGDRVKVRNSPSSEARPVAYFDKGVPVTLTARREGWAQVDLTDGRIGWVREDLLSGKANAPAVQVASTPTKPASKPITKHTVIAHKTEQSHEKVRKSARARQTEIAQRSSEKTRKHSPLKHKEVARVQHKHWTQSGQQTAHVRHYGRGSYIQEASAPKPTTEVLSEALSYRGTPYRYGGASRGGFDCSGFTSYLYNKRGVGLPHSASGQFHNGKQVAKGEMKPGDLVFFQTVTKGISHVGVYVGSGKFVHSSSRRSGGVRVDNLNEGYYNQRFRGARRVR